MRKMRFDLDGFNMEFGGNHEFKQLISVLSRFVSRESANENIFNCWMHIERDLHL